MSCLFKCFCKFESIWTIYTFTRRFWFFIDFSFAVSFICWALAINLTILDRKIKIFIFAATFIILIINLILSPFCKKTFFILPKDIYNVCLAWGFYFKLPMMICLITLLLGVRDKYALGPMVFILIIWFLWTVSVSAQIQLEMKKSLKSTNQEK